MVRSFALAVAALLALAIAPTAASAAATVEVSVGQTEIVVPTTQSYSFNLSFDSTPDRYTVAIVKPDGALYEPKQTVSITGRAAPITGTGTLTLPSDATEGYWTVKVEYFAQGQPAWEARAQKVFKVSRPVAPAPREPQPETPLPQPKPETPITVIPPQSTTAIPVIKLTKTASKQTVKAGRTVVFTLKVKNVGTVVAKNAKVCDAVPTRMTVTKLGKGRFENGKLCFSLGTLAVGGTASVKVTMRVDADAPRGTIVNRAVATADGARTVKATAKVKVQKTPRPRTAAPVTG